MDPSTRRTRAQRSRGVGPRHPTARRRWPRAYDGGVEEPHVNRRYDPELARDRETERRRSRRRSLLDELRQSPVRNGLVGLAVVGSAAPIAVNRYQQALRNNPEHEQLMARIAPVDLVSDSSVATAWRAMKTESSDAAAAREGVVSRKLTEFEEYGLTRELAEDIYDMAVKAEIDPEVAYGLVRAESSFKNQATSYVGAVGLTQLMPATAKWLEPGVTRDDLREPETNLRIGFGYLRQLIDKYDGNEDLALVAYNRGPGTVDRILKRGGNPDNGYASFVRTGDVGDHEL